MFADDTVILAVNNEDVEIYVQVHRTRWAYVWVAAEMGKMELLPVRCEARIKNPVLV